MDSPRSVSSDEANKMTTFSINFIYNNSLKSEYANNDIQIEKLIGICKEIIGLMHDVTYKVIKNETNDIIIKIIIEIERSIYREIRCKFLKNIKEHLPNNWNLKVEDRLKVEDT